MGNKKPLLPIILNWVENDKNGVLYEIEVRIEQTADSIKYPPDGIKSTFKIIRDNLNGKNELIVLIDNHEPHGFHYHNRLPEKHDSRKELKVKNWQEAWNLFDKMLEEILDEF